MEQTIAMNIHQGCLLLSIGDLGMVSLAPDQVEQLIQFWKNRPTQDTVITTRELLSEPPMN